MEPHQCSFIIPLVRTFIEGTSHKPCATWLEPQTNGKNIKEWRLQFLGNRESYRNLEHISVNTISTLVNSCTVGTAKTSFQHLLTLIELPQYLLELSKNILLRDNDRLFWKPLCFRLINNSTLTWSHNFSFWNTNCRTVSKCDTSMSCWAFKSTALLKSQNTPKIAWKCSNALSCAVANPFKLQKNCRLPFYNLFIAF